MATLTVFKFNDPEGAGKLLEHVKELSKQQLITLQDAAIVTWPKGKDKPKTQQLANMAGIGALDGAFWGMLFGMLFFVPFLGLAIGAAFGALGGKMADYGIDDDFINKTKAAVVEGTSALFLMTQNAVQDKVFDTLKDFDAEVISSNLTAEQEAALQAAFKAE